MNIGYVSATWPPGKKKRNVPTKGECEESPRITRCEELPDRKSLIRISLKLALNSGQKSHLFYQLIISSIISIKSSLLLTQVTQQSLKTRTQWHYWHEWWTIHSWVFLNLGEADNWLQNLLRHVSKFIAIGCKSIIMNSLSLCLLKVTLITS